ncbi:MAG: DNA gyrase inhibitor YacG [Chlamydiae bacterium]|nr:DNA gyrase inhibitor YacG [Chlamydiota bacterium]
MNKQNNHICPHCQKHYQLGENITWAFGSFCSRRCQDADLIVWLNNQYVVIDQEKDSSAKT